MLRRSNVQDLEARQTPGEREALRGVAHVRKVTRLLPVTPDRKRVKPRGSLGDERDHCVRLVLSLPVCGEDAGGNPFVDIAVPTGLGGLGRSVLIVRAAHAVIAIGGDYGTLSEITLALKAKTPVVGLDTWKLTRAGAQADDATIIRATNAADAVSAALTAAAARH
jgi:hypothetical protein